MLSKLSVFFLHKYKLGNKRFFCRRYIRPQELDAVFDESAHLITGKAFYLTDAGRLFVKTTRLKKWTLRLRVSLLWSRGAKGYDYPLADLINSLNVEASGVPTPKLIGFGYQSYLGLVTKISLLYEFLSSYSDGVKWLRENPNKAVELTCKAHGKILQLHSVQCYHLDMWLGNIMVPFDESQDIQLIDFEQYVSGVPGDAEALLGFMFGYFWSRELNQVLSAAEYDALSYRALLTECDTQSPGFQRSYQLSKQGKVKRRMRRQFFTEQKLPVAAG